MRLELPQPLAGSENTSVSISPLILLPDDIGAWVRKTMQVLIIRESEQTTTAGWPMRIVFGAHAIGAFYAFQEHGASAVARFADEAMLTVHREAMLRRFAAARPNFTGVVSCVAELADLRDRHDLREPATSTSQRHVEEIVFDQFPVGPFQVVACDVLDDDRADFRTLYAFRVVGLSVAVLVETSESARERGTPFVLVMVTPGHHHVIEAKATLSPYSMLKKTAIDLITRALPPL